MGRILLIGYWQKTRPVLIKISAPSQSGCRICKNRRLSHGLNGDRRLQHSTQVTAEGILIKSQIKGLATSGESDVRPRTFVVSEGLNSDLFRITYPANTSDGRQVIHVFEIDLTFGAPPKARFVTTLAEAGAHVLQVTVIEPDPSEVPHALITIQLCRPGPTVVETFLAPSLRTALFTWKAYPLVNKPITLRGAFVKRTGALGEQFDIVTWPGGSKTGDYSKIAFFYSDGKLKYFVPWIAEDDTGQRTWFATSIAEN